MKYPKISIITPVYNASRYIHRCVDSILSQTYTDFELLLIDDGSKDNSGEICDEYASIDSRIRVFHKPNGGVSSARNLGLDNASGEWISFVDADDWIEESMLEHLMANSDCELSVVSFRLEGTDEEWHDSIPDGKFINNIGTVFEGISTCCQLTSPWGKLFLRKIIHDHSIKFNIKISSGEDTLFVYEYITYIQSIGFDSIKDYHYNREGSTLSFNIQTKYHQLHLFIENYLEIVRPLCAKHHLNYNTIVCKGLFSGFVQYLAYLQLINPPFFKFREELRKMISHPELSLIIADKHHLPKGKRCRLFDFLATHGPVSLLTLYSKLIISTGRNIY